MNGENVMHKRSFITMHLARALTLQGIAWMLLLLAVMPSVAQTPRPAETLFYLVDSEDSFESFRTNVDQISIVAPQTYSVNEAGIIWGAVDPRVMRLAREHGVQVIPLLTNPGFSQEVLHDLMVDDSARRRAVQAMVDLAQEHDFDGWQFDFENIHIADRDLLTQFYREAATALHAAGRSISIAISPPSVGVTSDYHRWLYEYWRSGYDLAALGEIGDFMSFMTYSQHTQRTPPGPPAGIPWVTELVEMAIAEGVPPERISLGVPFYSIHWFAAFSERLASARGAGREGGFASGQGIDHARARGLLERYDADLVWLDEQGAQYAFWENAGVFEWLFLEDATSLPPKLDVLDEYGLRGISVWRLGNEDPAVWPVLRSRLRATRR